MYIECWAYILLIIREQCYSRSWVCELWFNLNNGHSLMIFREFSQSVKSPITYYQVWLQIWLLVECTPKAREMTFNDLFVVLTNLCCQITFKCMHNNLRIEKLNCCFSKQIEASASACFPMLGHILDLELLMC